jgi:hypothetical protein
MHSARATAHGVCLLLWAADRICQWSVVRCEGGHRRRTHAVLRVPIRGHVVSDAASGVIALRLHSTSSDGLSFVQRRNSSAVSSPPVERGCGTWSDAWTCDASQTCLDVRSDYAILNCGSHRARSEPSALSPPASHRRGWPVISGGTRREAGWSYSGSPSRPAGFAQAGTMSRCCTSAELTFRWHTSKSRCWCPVVSRPFSSGGTNRACEKPPMALSSGWKPNAMRHEDA